MTDSSIITDSGIKVMGARSQPYYTSWFVDYRADRVLRAIDATTLKPVAVFWRYEDEETAVYSESFRDTKPFKLLTVGKVDKCLRGSNISGYQDGHSFIRNDGTACSYNVWSNKIESYQSPNKNNDVYAAGEINGGFAMINRKGELLVPDKFLSELSKLDNVRQVITAYDGTILALKSDGTIYYHAVENSRLGPPPEEIAQLTDIVAIRFNHSSLSSVAVLRSCGKVLAWGAAPNSAFPNLSAVVPEKIALLEDIVELWASFESFIALRSNGQLVAWGDKQYSFSGGDHGIPKMVEDISALKDIVHVVSGEFVSVALRKNGTLVGLGVYFPGNFEEDDLSSYAVPREIAELNDVIDVQNLDGVKFAALRRNGTVVTWGSGVWGALVPEVPDDLTDVVAITCVHGSVAALNKEGSVVVFGDQSIVNSFKEKQSELVSVCAIYAADWHFIALTEDNRIITIGEEEKSLPEELQGKVSYEIPL